MRRYLDIAAFVLLTVGGGALIGALSAPDEWYAALEKPAFTPPGWLFGPVWTVLYVLIGVAGVRTFRRRPATRAAMRTWVAQLSLNFAWSPVFFTLHSIAAALVVILALLALVVLFVIRSWPRDRTAAWLFVPYAAWVAFATVLNASLLALD